MSIDQHQVGAFADGPPKLLRNGAFIAVGNVSQAALGFLYWLLAARSASAGDIGECSALISFLSFLAIVASLGFNSLLVQRLPGSSSRDWWRITNVTHSVAGLTAAAIGTVAFIAALASGRFLELGHHSYLVAVLVAGVVAQTSGILADAVYIAERAAHLALVRNVLGSVVKLILLVAFVLADWNAVTAIVVSSVTGIVVSGIAGFGPLLRRVRTEYRPALAIPRALRRSDASTAMGHYVMAVSAGLPMYLLPVVLLGFGSRSASAEFFLCWSVASLLFMISASVAQSLYAELRQPGAEGPALVRRAGRFCALVLVPGALGFALVGPFGLRIFGAQLAPGAAAVVPFLALAVPFDAITNFATAMLRAEHRHWAAAWINGSMAVTTLAVAVLTAPSLGARAGGLAYLVAQAVGTAAALAARATPRAREQRRAARAAAGAARIIPTGTPGALELPASD